MGDLARREGEERDDAGRRHIGHEGARQSAADPQARITQRQAHEDGAEAITRARENREEVALHVKRLEPGGRRGVLHRSGRAQIADHGHERAADHQRDAQHAQGREFLVEQPHGQPQREDDVRLGGRALQIGADGLGRAIVAIAPPDEMQHARDGEQTNRVPGQLRQRAQLPEGDQQQKK